MDILVSIKQLPFAVEVRLQLPCCDEGSTVARNVSRSVSEAAALLSLPLHLRTLSKPMLPFSGIRPSLLP
jgi:hypothetical protein